MEPHMEKRLFLKHGNPDITFTWDSGTMLKYFKYSIFMRETMSNYFKYSVFTREIMFNHSKYSKIQSETMSNYPELRVT